MPKWKNRNRKNENRFQGPRRQGSYHDPSTSKSTYHFNQKNANLQNETQTEIHKRKENERGYKGESSKKFKLLHSELPETKEEKFENQQFRTYEKREGTVDKGKKYEFLMSAYYALKFAFTDDVIDFEMTTNEKQYGDFDDLMLKLTFLDESTRTFLFQLKHLENPSNPKKHISLENLVVPDYSKESKNYSLPKYLKSFNGLKNKDITLILYTNNIANFDNGAQFWLENCPTTVKRLHNWKNDPLLAHEGNTESKTFQFETIDNFQKFSGFFRQFYVLTQQKNTSDTKSLIRQMLEQRCALEDDSDVSSFVQFAERWWSGNFVINKSDVMSKLAELVFSPWIQTLTRDKLNQKTEQIRNGAAKFEITIVGNDVEDVATRIWNVEANDLDVVGKVARKFGFCESDLTDLKQLSSKDVDIILWHLKKMPLIVKMREENKPRIQKGVDLLQNNNIILVGNATKNEFPKRNVLETLADLLEDNSLNLNQFFVKFQGREDISLKKLVELDPEIAKHFGIGELFKMSQGVLQIGEKEESPVDKSYVSRSISTFFLDAYKMLLNHKNMKNVIIIVTNCDQNFKGKIDRMGINAIELEKYRNNVETNNLVVLITEGTYSVVQFQSICQNHKENVNVYVVKILDDMRSTLVLSRTSPSFLKFMGAPKLFIKESEIFRHFTHPINFICAQPGMGKTTMLNLLATRSPSSYWCVKIKLINCLPFVSGQRPFEDILPRFLQMQTTSDPLVSCMKLYFLKTKRIFLFLDGVDELHSEGARFVQDYVKYISAQGVTVWLSSRQSLREEISNCFNLFPIDIREFSDEQQEKYLKSRLEDVLGVEKIEDITRRIVASADVANGRRMLGIPLQLYIITENFRENPNLSDNLDEGIFVLTKMYQIFFKETLTHLLSKMNLQHYGHLYGESPVDRLRKYELLSLKVCLGDEDFEKLDINRDDYRRFLNEFRRGDSWGIIERISEEGVAIFAHQTFAEYSACRWFSRQENFRHIKLLEDIWFSSKYENMKSMLEIMWAEDSPLHRAVIYNNENLFDSHCKDSSIKDAGGRTALHLICCYGQRTSFLTSDYDSIFQTSVLSTSYKQMFEKLFSTEALHQKDEVFEYDCLDYAFKSNCLHLMERISDVVVDKLSEMDRFACCAAVHGYPNLLAAIIKKQPDILQQKFLIEEASLLHIASIRNSEQHQRILDDLLRCGLDINVRDRYNKTPLRLAIEYSIFDNFKFLLDQGADIGAVATENDGALHLAARGHQSNERIMQILLERGISVNDQNSEGETALHIAVARRHLSDTKLLLQWNPDFSILTKHNETMLHYTYDLEQAELLLNAGVDPTVKNTEDKDALMNAIEEGEFEMADMFLKTNRFSPQLNFAVYSGNSDLVSSLLDEMDKKGRAVDQMDVNNSEYPLYIVTEEGQLQRDLLLKLTELIKSVRDLLLSKTYYFYSHQAMIDELKRKHSKSTLVSAITDQDPQKFARDMVRLGDGGRFLFKETNATLC